MMRLRKTKQTGISPVTASSANVGGGGGGGEPDTVDWEMRPGGMLVQKRLDSDQNSPAPIIRVRVKHGSTYHVISVSSQATFGELKKKLTGPTGLHHDDQKVFFKDKERDSKSYLDITGVKNKSKLVVVEDPISQEKRYLEMRKNAKMEKAAKSISDISLEVDKLAGHVSALESVMSEGGKVGEKDVVNLIELLMNELIKLDAIVADGDVKLQRKIQVRRVQKYVETLDLLKIKNSTATCNGAHHSSTNQNQQGHLNGQTLSSPSPINQRQPKNLIGYLPQRPKSPQHQHQDQELKRSSSGTVVTTQWEIFDSTSSLNSDSSSSAPLIPLSSSSTSGPAAHSNRANHQKFNWEFFE